MGEPFDIFVDSSANLTEEMIAETGIKVIPFTCTVNGVQRLCFEDGVPFKQTAKNFYEELEKGAEIKTSLICEADFIEAVTPSMEQGKDALLVTITSSLSGTYAQAMKAKSALKEIFPDRNLYVVDSANASLGEGLLAVNAAKLRDLGESIEACAEWITENRYKMNSYVTVNDLKYLRKGGRVSAVAAIAGAILNIKPLLKADGNSPAKLVVYAKERGRKKSIEAIISAFKQNVLSPESQTIAITHCNCEEEALLLAERLKGLGAKDITIEYYDLCTGSHVGPGTIALFFAGKDRRNAAAATEAAPKGKTFFKKFKQEN